MNFFSKLFKKKQKTPQRASITLLFEEVTKLENLFSDEILKNPDVGNFNPNDYKSFAYSRCSWYQEQLVAQKSAIEKVLADNDGTISKQVAQDTAIFLQSVLEVAKIAAQEFYAILDKSDSQPTDVKKKLNRQCYNLSVEKRSIFLKTIIEFKESKIN